MHDKIYIPCKSGAGVGREKIYGKRHLNRSVIGHFMRYTEQCSGKLKRGKQLCAGTSKALVVLIQYISSTQLSTEDSVFKSSSTQFNSQDCGETRPCPVMPVMRATLLPVALLPLSVEVEAVAMIEDLQKCRALSKDIGKRVRKEYCVMHCSLQVCPAKRVFAKYIIISIIER
jgi:hypothetical protein